MTTDDVKILKNIKINRFSSFCDLNDYVYSQHIVSTICLGDKFHPNALENSCNGVFLIDYTKVVKYLIDNPKLLDSRFNFNYFVVEDRNKPNLSRFDVYYIKDLTPKQAQKIINANVAAFTQYNAAVVEQELINQVNTV
jgi:hypothetical protein